jgi:phosphatidate phosphatase LPIN
MSFDLFLYSGTTRSKVIKNNKLIISKETSFQIDTISNRIINNNFSVSNNIKIELSNSWNTISKNKDDSKFDIHKIFTESQYTKEEFFKDPWKIINNTNLAIKHGKHIYTWKVIAPLLISYLAYGESLPEQTLNSLTAQQNGFLMWKTIENNAYKIELTTKNIINDNNSNTNTSTTSETNASSSRSKHSQNTKKRKYKKSYYFTSEHLSQMNLNYGRNTVQFKIKTPYYGNNVLVADIYLWNYNDKIIISDYDGTITRTDVIGMFFGWTHKKVALLYNNLDRNGYKIIYLTARPVCTHERTKNTLFSLTQDSLKMPKGPVLMSPDGFFISLKKEVIDRTPQEFKIEFLTHVLNLFSGTQPFYAGIGNKQSDVYAYETVGVPRDKIFIINEKGEVRTPANRFHLTTFKQIHEEIDLMFPDVKGGNTYFYDVDYYKPKLDDKEVDVDEWFK